MHLDNAGFRNRRCCQGQQVHQLRSLAADRGDTLRADSQNLAGEGSAVRANGETLRDRLPSQQIECFPGEQTLIGHKILFADLPERKALGQLPKSRSQRSADETADRMFWRDVH